MTPSLGEGKSKALILQAAVRISLASPNGLPYIRRDGVANPDVKSDATDAARLVRFTSTIETLGLAYFFTGNAAYDAKSICPFN